MRNQRTRLSRMEKLRGYRAVLMTECSDRVDRFLATPSSEMTESEISSQNDYIRRVQLRMKLINNEVVRIVSADPRVLKAA